MCICFGCRPDFGLVDKAGWTALHCACQQGHMECARLLLEHGLKVRAKSVEGFEPIHLAAQARSLGSLFVPSCF